MLGLRGHFQNIELPHIDKSGARWDAGRAPAGCYCLNGSFHPQLIFRIFRHSCWAFMASSRAFPLDDGHDGFGRWRPGFRGPGRPRGWLVHRGGGDGLAKESSQSLGMDDGIPCCSRPTVGHGNLHLGLAHVHFLLASHWMNNQVASFCFDFEPMERHQAIKLLRMPAGPGEREHTRLFRQLRFFRVFIVETKLEESVFMAALPMPKVVWFWPTWPRRFPEARICARCRR